MYSYVKNHFIKCIDDRLILLNVYRTLHLVIPEASPLSGALLLELLEHAGNSSSKKNRETTDLISEDGNGGQRDHYLR